jgi:osmoprotectant transport system permease protein
MRRWIVLVILLMVLVGLTIWTTSAGDIGIFHAFTYADILTHSKDHLIMVFWAVLIAVLVGVPLGTLVTRPGFKRISPLVLGGANVGQSIPSLAIIAIMATLPFSLFFFDFGFNRETAIVALFVYGLLPIVRNSYASMQNINPALVESARGMGMTRWQIIRKIELPLALPVIMTGIRVSTVVTVGTAELAVLVGGKGLGTITFTGVFAREVMLIIQGAAPTAFLAVSLGVILEGIEKWITPRGLKIKAKNI